MPQNVRPAAPYVGASAELFQQVGDVMFRRWLAIVVAQHARTAQMPVLFEGRREPVRHRHVANAIAFDRAHLAVPVIPFHTELSLL